MKRSTPLAAACAALLALAACQDGVVDTSRSSLVPPDADAAQLGRGFILRDGKPFEVRYEVRDGRAIFEGDIDLGPAAQIAHTREELQGPRRAEGGPSLGVVTDASGKRWSGGVVAYVIESDVPNQFRIHNAIAQIEANAPGIDFVPRTNQQAYIVFRRTTDPAICGSSPVGNSGGGQALKLHDDCGTGTVLHELGHALGMWHEQSRCDRDSYVQILWSNIVPDRDEEFQKHCAGAFDIGSYDEGSIMHYPSTAYGKTAPDGSKMTTIVSLRGLPMGQRFQLSATDAYTLGMLYRPHGPANYTSSYPGNVPTLSWSPSPTALSYTVYLTEVNEEFISDRGTFSWENVTVMATTTGTSVTDPAHSYTGNGGCILSTDSSGGYVGTWMYYDVVANYPNGAPSQVSRIEAFVVTC